jgi:acetyltransferase-like isoleucine patch superfamily enzyme
MPNNIIHPTAKVAKDCKIGNFSFIGQDVKIQDGCLIGNNVVILAGTEIGKDVRIDENTVVGKQPMKAKNSAITKIQRLTPAIIGNGCIIGSSAVIYAGCSLGNDCLVADLATVRENVVVGTFTILGRNVTVECFTKIGSYCKIETNAYITAYSELEDRVFIAPGVVTSNDNFVGRTEERFKHFKGIIVKKGGRIGANVTVLPSKVIGEDALVAAGSVVTKDVPPKKIVMGCPARVIRDVPQEQLLANQGWKDV